jgi:hypothetical protein
VSSDKAWPVNLNRAKRIADIEIRKCAGCTVEVCSVEWALTICPSPLPPFPPREALDSERVSTVNRHEVQEQFTPLGRILERS